MPILKEPPVLPKLIGSPEPLRMTEAEFVQWSGQEGMRVEWVDGEVVFMNAVSDDHADLAAFIIHLLRAFVDELELGKVRHEPFQVRLPKQRRRRMPDVFFVSMDRSDLLEKQQFNGAPDLVVEIISSDSKVRDRRVKFAEYQAAGVREYWIVDPVSRRSDAFTLGINGRFDLIKPAEGTTHSVVLPGLFFRTDWVWQLKFPKVSGLTRQMIRNRKKLPAPRSV